MDQEDTKDQVNELHSNYNKRISITTLEDLEERDRELTLNMTFDERMAYLNRLIRITFSEEDLIKLEEKFISARIQIKKQE